LQVVARRSRRGRPWESPSTMCRSNAQRGWRGIGVRLPRYHRPDIVTRLA
jgi:hypothetical protein